jgi:hypothetical protein
VNGFVALFVCVLLAKAHSSGCSNEVLSLVYIPSEDNTGWARSTLHEIQRDLP